MALSPPFSISKKLLSNCCRRLLSYGEIRFPEKGTVLGIFLRGLRTCYSHVAVSCRHSRGVNASPHSGGVSLICNSDSKSPFFFFFITSFSFLDFHALKGVARAHTCI